MAHETPTITAKTRDKSGTRYAQRLRKVGRLPAVIYGRKTDPVSVSVDEEEILALIQHGAHAMYVDVEGAGRETCLVKELQYGYLGDNVIHVDLARVNMEDEVEVHVHLTFGGLAVEAQKSDAILRHDLTELYVRCKVIAIPEDIRVDLSTMEGTQLSAGEVPLPDGVTLAGDPDALVASVSFLRVEEEATGEEAEVTGADGDPEVITESTEDKKDDKSA